MLKLILIILTLSGCLIFKSTPNNNIDKNITSKIVCSFLSNLTKDSQDTMQIYKGFLNDIKSPEHFIRKYGNQTIDFEPYLASTWIEDKNINEKCQSYHHLIISKFDFAYTNFNPNVKILRLSEFYFLGRFKGFFIASTICGSSCEVADIYIFDIEKDDKISIRLFSPYFVN